MHIKWFFVIFGLGFTFLMIMSILFIGNYITFRADERFENSTLIHKFLFDNITELRNDWDAKLDPILDQIPNATESRIEQDRHYNQSQDLADIIHAMGNNSEIIEQNKQQRQLLIDINRTLSELVYSGEISKDPPFVINNVTQPK